MSIKGVTHISVKEDPQPGAIYLPRGEWRTGAVYTRTDSVIEFVIYDGYAYECLKPGVTGGNDPHEDIKVNGGNWKSMGQYDVIATRILLANFAVIAGAVFWNSRLMSQKGTDSSGNPSDTFTNYREDSSGNETGTFHPNVLIDFQNGRLKAKNAEIEGIIRATGGKFNGYLQTPYVNLGTLTANATLNLSSGFNFVCAGNFTYGVKTLYLPSDASYNGMNCTIFARSFSKNSVAVRVRITGGGDFYYPGYNTQIYGVDVFNRKLKLEAMPNSGNTAVTWYIDNYCDFDESDLITS
ncbi:MAG: hypothetical protein LBK58_02055 [Prevotellaceae bacterium]|jgi:hypothetical protein|nr:hypothetical protein [Prevotellaceae bacterium]